MIIYATENNYSEVIQDGFVIVDFYSETCGPCKNLAKVLEELVAEVPFLTIVKVNTTKFPALGASNHIELVPTMIFVKDGKEVEKTVGSMPLEGIKEIVEKYLYS
jgi:thioredoxin 1